jgi:hypothetical protein
VCVLQYERQAVGANRSTGPHLARGEGVELAAEEVDPEVPVHRDPKKSLADGDEEAACEMVLGAKL